jgi:hypothetical protein
MRCPGCNTENATPTAGQAACSNCGGPLPAPRRKPRRRDDGIDSPFGRREEGSNGVALLAYRLAVYGLVPGAGLVLGPLAVALGLKAKRQGRGDPEFTAAVPARAAVIVGGTVALTSWVGLALMVLGLRSLLG